MLSRETERKIRRHVRLSRGLLDTTLLAPESSEFEERNALSRGYYALLHASSALVLTRETELSKSHGGLHDQVQRRLGRSFGQFMRDLYKIRKFSDYEPDWLPIRHVSDANLKTVLDECRMGVHRSRKEPALSVSL
jgi:uncharacterized protein (UPF0332 family)